ncbi:MAG TPA: autotransporter-associated beta strand repeat-containing protein, partial [Gemmataceae bacterium]|nr:autotransporter-associated beta strand repeat-containing protein [Gemmataceae bacterium]
MSQIVRSRRWTGWSSRKPSLIRPFPALRCEELENRVTPTTFTWTGATNNLWSVGTNWLSGVAPTGDAGAVEDLVFGSQGTARPNTSNDLPAATFNSITFAVGGYTLGGNAITLGRPVSGSGVVTVASGALSNTIALPMTLGAATGSDQTFTVNAGGSLTVSGSLSGSTGSTLTKDGPGDLTLSANNSGFTGTITLRNNAGATIITNQFALGSATAETVVNPGSSLRVNNSTGTITGPINEPIRLNGLGVANDGALLNLAGNSTWAGPVILDSSVALGANAGVLSITGLINDQGAGWNLIKEGAGEVQLNSPTGNQYRGLTIINNGILTAGSAKALGDPANGGAGTAGSGTIVNQTLTGTGQLRLADPAGVGFTVVDEFLTLNGNGAGGNGALSNTKGNNTWAGPVILGSPAPDGKNVQIGAAANTDLTISGVVSSPNGTFQLIKVDNGRLILNNANTYTGVTNINAGTLTARDSKALGATSAGTNVANGATLELQVEAQDPVNIPRFDAQGRDLWNDSVTGNPNKLLFTEPLSISGRGVGTGGGVGALRSVSGINIYAANIALADPGSNNVAAAIGVELDQRPGHPTPDASYFTNDYSLTVTGTISGGDFNEFIKRGTGQLILPVANTYTGRTRIEQGWVTIQNNRALGADKTPIVSKTIQPATYVSNGAALHIKPLTPASPPLNIPENLQIAGTGPAHPYAFISQKGALMNLGGINEWSGDIGFIGASGIGVEQTDPASPSELTVTGSTSDGKNSFTFTANGGAPEQSFLVDTGGSATGTIHVESD